MIEYRSINDLNRDIRHWVTQLPNDINLVVGVPRSGLLAANLLALHKNIPITDVDGYIEKRLLTSGFRYREDPEDFWSNPVKALILDDSAWSGRQMDEVRQKLADSSLGIKPYFAAVYSTMESRPYLDYYFEEIEGERCFEWNILQHRKVASFCMDIDGVLCRDPLDEENDDGDKYLDFIENVPLRFHPRKKIASLVSCRLEKYRSATEAWLKKNNIEYGELFLMNHPDKESRIKAGNHAQFKADIYLKTGARLFVESSKKQAEKISSLTGRDVFCVDEMVMIRPDLLTKANASADAATERIFKAGKLLVNDPKELISRQINKLKRILGGEHE